MRSSRNSPGIQAKMDHVSEPLTLPAITSAQNQHFKRWRSFTSSPQDPACPWVLLESPRAILDASRTVPISLLLHSGDSPLLETLLPRCRKHVRLSPSLLKRLSQVVEGQGVLAFFDKPAFVWAEMTQQILYLETVQDPGNLGTLLRTAQATGLFSVVTSPQSVSVFNSKVVRASSGALFRVPFLENITARELRRRGHTMLALVPSGGADVLTQAPEGPTAFLLGNEGNGLSQEALQASDLRVSLPMRPGVDSVNVAVAGSILMYHTYRRIDGP